MKKIHIKPIGFWERILDLLAFPFMLIASGTISEKPRRTNKWNNRRLHLDEVKKIDTTLTCMFRGIPSANVEGTFLGIPKSYIPILGGWKKYVVLKPCTNEKYYIGWITGDFSGVSRIPMKGHVRVLLGDGDVLFFAIGADSGLQKPVISCFYHGRIGDRSVNTRIPLL